MNQEVLQKKVKIGVLSTAGIATKLIPSFQESKYIEVVAVASRSIEKAQNFIENLNENTNLKYNIKPYGSYEDLLNDKEIDAVYIPLPTGYKFEWAKKSIENGKHVLVEKPLCGTTDTKELQELINLCAENNKQFMDGTMFLHSDRTNLIRQKIYQEQEIGQVKKVIANLSFVTNDSFNQNNIRVSESLEPLGALGDLTWYTSMASLFAFNFEKPEKIQAVSWMQNQQGVYTDFAGILHFSGGRMAYVDGSFNESKRENFEIVGDKGSYRLDDFCSGNGQNGARNGTLIQYKGAGTYKYKDASGKSFEKQIQSSDQVLNLVDEFGKNILSGKINSEWSQRTLLNQQIMVLFNLSAKQDGKIIKYELN